MNSLDKQIMIALLGSQQSMYGLEQFLKESGIKSNYATVYRHIKRMQSEGLLRSSKVARKNGKQDNRGTEKPEITARGFATLVIDGDLQKNELVRAMKRELNRSYRDLPPSFLPETQMDDVFSDTVLKMKYKINLRFFDENYFNRIFNLSFAESLLDQIKKHNFQKNSGLKAKAPTLKKKYVNPAQIEALRNLKQQFIVERDNCNYYVKILSTFLETLGK